MAEKPTQDLFDLDALSKESIADLPETFFQDDGSLGPQGAKYVVFQINGDSYAVPTEEVSEVVRMLPLTEIPNLPAWFLGIGNLRGDIVSVIDFAAYSKKEPGQALPKSKLIVLRSGNSDTNLALRVDRLREIVTLSDDVIEAPEDGAQPFLAGSAKLKSTTITVLAPTKLTTSLTLR